MPLDTLTLRVALAVVDLTLLTLFYFIAYRRTRSPYSAWWCVALSLFLLGNAAYLLDGTAHQQWANPHGQRGTGGGRGVYLGRCPVVADHGPADLGSPSGPAITAVAAVLDQPATNVWAGGPVYLFFMAALIGLGCRELLLLDRDFSRAHRPLALAAGSLCGLLRRPPDRICPGRTRGGGVSHRLRLGVSDAHIHRDTGSGVLRDGGVELRAADAGSPGGGDHGRADRAAQPLCVYGPRRGRAAPTAPGPDPVSADPGRP